MSDTTTVAKTEESSSSSSSSAVRVRLMLHSVNGIVPYLTPDTLKRCFPAQEFNDVLLIGEAIRDTCLVPVFESPNKKKAKKKVPAGPPKNADTKAVPPPPPLSKPRGYVFSSDVQPDQYMLSYHRMTVPTFDLMSDNSNNGVYSSSTSATSQHVCLWTSNGRHPITNPQYTACAATRNATHVVSLFDMIHPETTTTTSTANATTTKHAALAHKKRLKYKQAVLQRNQQWTKSCIENAASTRLKACKSQQTIWAPLAVSSDTDFCTDSNDQQALQWIAAAAAAATQPAAAAVAGVALVGWQHIENPKRRWQILQSVTASPQQHDSKAPAIAVLSTISLAQILQLLQLSSHCNSVIVGTNLPTMWAWAKKAFVCDIAAAGDDEDDNNKPPSSSSRKRPRPSSDNMITLDADGCFHLDHTTTDKDPSTHPWFRDGQPLVPGCSCMTCQQHSRSFIYHLVCSKELLAEILLFIHNLHHLLTLFRSVNKLCCDGNFNAVADLCEHVQRQLIRAQKTNGASQLTTGAS